MKLMKYAAVGFALSLVSTHVFASSGPDYGVFYSHELLQTSNSAPVDYNTGDIPGNTVPGPYSYGAFDHLTPGGTLNSSSVTLPNSTNYPMVFTTDDNAWNYHSTATGTLATTLALYPTGNYSVAGSGPGSGAGSGPLNLTAGSFPNTPQVLQVNGGAAQWLGNSLILNPYQANTITWTAFTNYVNAIGANIALSVYAMTGGVHVVDQQAFTGPSGTGASPFSSYTFNANDLLGGQTYVASIDYIQFTDLTTASGGYDVAGNETETNFIIQTVPEANNFWLTGFAFIGVALGLVWRRKDALLIVA